MCHRRLSARAPVDDRTLELTFRFQVPYIRELLTHYTSFAVPRHVVEKYGESWTRPEHIVVNGPYLLKEWIPNEHIRLERNPRFFDAANVPISTVYFYPTQDSSAALKRFRGGEFDLVTDSVPPQQIHWLELYLPHELRLSPYILCAVRCSSTSTANRSTMCACALALSLAIDREIMVTKVTRAGETTILCVGAARHPPLSKRRSFHSAACR